MKTRVEREQELVEMIQAGGDSLRRVMTLFSRISDRDFTLLELTVPNVVAEIIAQETSRGLIADSDLRKQRREQLEQLGTSEIGIDHIERLYQIATGQNPGTDCPSRAQMIEAIIDQEEYLAWAVLPQNRRDR